MRGGETEANTSNAEGNGTAGERDYIYYVETILTLMMIIAFIT